MHYSDDADSCKYTYIYIYMYTIAHIYSCTALTKIRVYIYMYIHIHTCTRYSADENLDDARRLLAQVEGHPPSRAHTWAGIMYVYVSIS